MHNFLLFLSLQILKEEPAKWFGKGNLFLCTIKFLFYGKIKMTSERNVSGASCGIKLLYGKAMKVRNGTLSLFYLPVRFFQCFQLWFIRTDRCMYYRIAIFLQVDVKSKSSLSIIINHFSTWELMTQLKSQLSEIGSAASSLIKVSFYGSIPSKWTCLYLVGVVLILWQVFKVAAFKLMTQSLSIWSWIVRSAFQVGC